MSELREQKTHYVTPWGKSPRFFVHTVLVRKFCRQVRRDKFTKLMQHLVGVIFFTTRVLWSESGAGHLFYPGLTNALKRILWDSCENILKII